MYERFAVMKANGNILNDQYGDAVFSTLHSAREKANQINAKFMRSHHCPKCPCDKYRVYLVQMSVIEEVGG